ncbi:MAG: CehA/McbA family metallohydrolase [Acidimicrobiia bacterium]
MLDEFPLVGGGTRGVNLHTLVDTAGKLSIFHRQRHLRFPFDVLPGVVQLKVGFRYRPGQVSGYNNLLTVALFDPRGLRGAAHRWQQDQTIEIGERVATPGFLAGPILTGAWECVVDLHEILNHGVDDDWCEYQLTIEVDINGPEPRHGVEPAKDYQHSIGELHEGWFRGDLHSHTIHCDGSAPANDMAAAAVLAGLDFLAITGHNTTSSLEVPPSWPPGLAPIRGVELTTFRGHANLLGIDRWYEWRDLPIADVQRKVRSGGGVFVVNHPAAIGNPWCTGCRWDAPDADLEMVDAIEVWNGPWANRDSRNGDGLAWWTALLGAGYRISAVGGGDAHSPSDFSRPGMPITEVFTTGLSEAAVLGGLQQGNVVVSSGPRLRLTTEDGDPVLPGTDQPEGATFVAVTELSTSATLWLVAEGEIDDRHQIEAPGAIVKQLIPAGARWARWELRAGGDIGDDLLTVTNPLWQPARSATAGADDAPR